MWMMYAFLAAVFAGTVSVLTKVGLQQVDVRLATGLRTGVVVVMAWLVVALAGTIDGIFSISGAAWFFLIISGLSTGISWLAFFKALQMGSVNRVVPLDRTGMVLTMLLAVVFLGEELNWAMIVAMPLMVIGIVMMARTPKKHKSSVIVGGRNWVFYALLAALFASLTAIFTKAGLSDVDANLALAIRTLVVFVMAWVIVGVYGKQKEIKQINGRNWIFLLTSAIATGLSWIFFFMALKDGPASVVVPIDRLSIIFVMTFAFFILKEKLSKTALLGLIIIVGATMLLAVTTTG